MVDKWENTITILKITVPINGNYHVYHVDNHFLVIFNMVINDMATNSNYGTNMVIINCYMVIIIIINMVIIWINMEYYGNMVINGDHHLSIDKSMAMSNFLVRW